LDDLRVRILTESKAGFQISLEGSKPISQQSSTFEIVRAMAHAWDVGGMEAVATIISSGGMDASNQHLWAVVGDLAAHLPASDRTAKALASIKRSSATVASLVTNVRPVAEQTDMFQAVEL
jgi:hypothetical protein